MQNQNLDYSIEPNFPTMNIFLPININENKIEHPRYYLRTIKIEEYNVIIDGKFFLDQPIKNHKEIYDNI